MEFFKEMTDQELDELFYNPEYIYFVGMISPPRPGFFKMMVRLEHEHFPPSSPLNDEYLLATIEWEGIVWAVVGIPEKKKDLLLKLLDETGLRLAEGVPTIISRGTIDQFPLNHSKVFTIENKRGHPVYSEGPEDLISAEQSEVSQYRDHFSKKS